MTQNDNNRYFQNPRSELSPEQLHAIDLLVTGATDQHVADTIGRARITVTRWRLYHPHFRAELGRQRRRAYGGAADAVRTVIPMALDTLRDQLRVGAGRGHIALGFLHKAGLTSPGLLSGVEDAPADDERQILAEILDAAVRRRRAEIMADDPDDELNIPPSAPVGEAERQAAMQYLLSLASEPDPAGGPPDRG